MERKELKKRRLRSDNIDPHSHSDESQPAKMRSHKFEVNEAIHRPKLLNETTRANIQAEDCLLQESLASLMRRRVDSPDVKFLHAAISPYLTDYPFIAGDVRVLSELRKIILHPPTPPDWVFATGTFDLPAAWAHQQRDQAIRRQLENARHDGTDRGSSEHFTGDSHR